MLLAVVMTGTAEALSLGVDNGLDPAVLSEIIKRSTGGNWSLNACNPYPGSWRACPRAAATRAGFSSTS